jgi:N-acetyltransferase
MWENLASRLEGSLITLEPLEPRHERGLFEAAQDPRIWRYLPFDTGGGTYDPAETREGFRLWLQSALAESAAGNEAAFTTLDARTGRPIGSTRYLALRPAHRSREIGWTWLAPSFWRTGANVEAKLLMLEHVFEQLGCLRVEFKTDACNERSRAPLAAQFEGGFRKHMIVRGNQYRDSAYYSIIDDEWPEVVKRRFEKNLFAQQETGKIAAVQHPATMKGEDPLHPRVLRAPRRHKYHLIFSAAGRRH